MPRRGSRGEMRIRVRGGVIFEASERVDVRAEDGEGERERER